MDELHRAKIELSYTKTIKARYIQKVELKLEKYNNKIDALESLIKELEDQ